MRDNENGGELFRRIQQERPKERDQLLKLYEVKKPLGQFVMRLTNPRLRDAIAFREAQEGIIGARLDAQRHASDDLIGSASA